MKLFDDFDFPEGNQEKDDTNICQALLYYDEPDFKLFKKLCKAAMKVEYPETYTKANISDLILKILTERYGTHKEVEAAIKNKSRQSGVVEGGLFGGG